jgi:hypothetical protein
MLNMTNIMVDKVTLLLEECEDDIHTFEMGSWEFIGTFKISKFDCRGQNILYWSVLYIIVKLSKCRYRKWVHMNHLDICNTSYGKKKGQKLN